MPFSLFFYLKISGSPGVTIENMLLSFDVIKPELMRLVDINSHISPMLPLQLTRAKFNIPSIMQGVSDELQGHAIRDPN